MTVAGYQVECLRQKTIELRTINAELLAANAKLKDALQDAVYEIQKLETEATDE